MKEEQNILDKLNHCDGMTVPEGYFTDFARQMEASLPERPELSSDPSAQVPRSWWERLRPYAYLAAMFAGVWCMLRLFTMLSSGPQPFENNPRMAEAFSDDNFVNEYVIPGLNQWDLYDDLMEDGVSPQSLLDSAEYFGTDTIFPSDFN